MNIFFISYENIDYGGRTLELLRVSNKIGQVYGLVRGSKKLPFANHLTVIAPNTTYSQFVRLAIDNYDSKNTDVLFIDNRKAALVANLLRKRERTKIIYDMRELRIPAEIRKLSSKLGCIPEKRIIQRADLVISASQERSEYISTNYRVRNCTSYENIRKLEYSEDYSEAEYDEKYECIFSKHSFKIISTSGTTISRGNDKLVEAVLHSNEDIDLLLVGGSGMEPESEGIIRSIIQSNDMENIHIIDMVQDDELKYLIDRCDCGVVNYHSKDTNNRLCASGKIFEFIFEGIPVITTSNPPLVRMTNEYGIGCSGEDYTLLIKEMIANYQHFKINTVATMSKISVEKNNIKLVSDIQKIVSD